MPHLLRLLGDSDYKVEFHYALIFGQIGAAAVGTATASMSDRERCHRTRVSSSTRWARSNRRSLKQRDHVGVGGTRIIVERSAGLAARTLGKIVENVSASDVAPHCVPQICARLIAALRDTHSGVRAKACRSLGKMAKRGWLDRTEIDILSQEIAHLLGKDSQALGRCVRRAQGSGGG